MKISFIAIVLSTSSLVLASSNDLISEYFGLQSRELDRWVLLRRSPMENTPSSSKKRTSDTNRPRPTSLGEKKRSEGSVSPSEPRTPVPEPRKPVAVGEVHASYPAHGFLHSEMHGEWQTHPKQNFPSQGKMKHPGHLCVGGSCSSPNGVVTADTIGNQITTRIQTRKGGTAQIAHHENLNEEPQWKSYGPNEYHVQTTTANPNELARHHARLEGPGVISSDAYMGDFKKGGPPFSRLPRQPRLEDEKIA